MRNLQKIFFLILAAEYSLHAALPESYGVGAVMTSQAGAGVASVDDWSAAFYNSAGLAAPAFVTYAPTDERGQVERYNQVGASIGVLMPMMTIKNDPGSLLADRNAKIAADLPAFSILQLGAVLDMRAIVDTPHNIPVKIGFVVNQIGDGSQILRLEETGTAAYRFQNLGRSAERMGGIAALALQPWKNRLSLGAGVNFSAALSGTVQLSQISADANKPPHVESDLRIKLATTPVAGVQFTQPLGNTQRLAAGVAFRAENQVKANIDVLTTLPVAGLDVIHTTAVRLAQYYTPHTYTAGVTYTNTFLQISLDAEYQQWSGYTLSVTRQVREANPRFKDILTPRLGFSLPITLQMLRKLHPRWRGGYSFIPSFVPDQNEKSNYLDNDRHLFSTGLSFVVPKNLLILSDTIIDISFQWQMWMKRNAVKTQPAELSDGSLQPNYTYGGNLYATHIAATLVF